MHKVVCLFCSVCSGFTDVKIHTFLWYTIFVTACFVGKILNALFLVMMTSSNENIFHVTGHLCEIHRSPVNYAHIFVFGGNWSKSRHWFSVIMVWRDGVRSYYIIQNTQKHKQMCLINLSPRHAHIRELGQFTTVGLACYLVLLSFDSKTRWQYRRTFITWPISSMHQCNIVCIWQHFILLFTHVYHCVI